MPQTLRIRRLAPEDREWAALVLERHWGSTRVVTRGRLHRCDRLPGFVAARGDERKTAA